MPDAKSNNCIYLIINVNCTKRDLSLFCGCTSFTLHKGPPDLCPLMVKDTRMWLVVSINWTYTLVCIYTHRQWEKNIRNLIYPSIYRFTMRDWEKASVSSSAVEGPHPRLEVGQVAIDEPSEVPVDQTAWLHHISQAPNHRPFYCLNEAVYGIIKHTHTHKDSYLLKHKHSPGRLHTQFEDYERSCSLITFIHF